MTTDNPTQIRTEAVSVSFGGLRAISNVSLSLAKGEILGLIGPNGAGKTTLVNCLTGFQRPTGGRVLVNGHDTSKWHARTFRMRGIARTFQGGRLFKEMSVLENVEVTGVSLGLRRRAAALEAHGILASIGSDHLAHRLAGTLPYTDERRVAIARALVMKPDFLLLDEPAAGMSDHECEDLMNIVRSLPDNHGCGVLLIEHNMSVVMGLCGRIHVLDGGRTLTEGAPDDVRNDKSVVDAYLGSDV
ncbi:ABC transporter ATP-binding protein [Rhizobium etli]|uniref:ABC transporter ATP-binding protein n=1 Tax=Rhizobium etli TaxID=29449 RepID=UPI0003839EA8|nr:ABC transporter ATP-binding protein [Rhizobium etli]AGS26568.1 high-affinity branched-chain amino acid ABC transporter ATP-binding protein [Rhizobium etli bv. mimosae str. Mim1]